MHCVARLRRQSTRRHRILASNTSRFATAAQNDCQLALTELKLAGAKALTYEQFWAVFGDCDGNALREHYPAMRPHLTEVSAAFWDRKAPVIGNLMYSGSSG